MENMEGLAVSLGLMSEMLERYWDTVHPQLEPDESADPTMRLNALGPLADNATFLRDVRRATVVAFPDGRVLVRDMLVASGKLPASGEPGPNEVQITAMLRRAASEDSPALKAAVASADAVVTLQKLLSDRGLIAHPQAPDLRPLNDILHVVSAACAAVLGESASSESDASTATSDAGAGTAQARPAGLLSSREDAIRMLENVCKFIEQTEPSNPAPLFIRRAQRLIGRNFVEIIQDLAPDSVGQINRLAGIEDKS
jgi:type VI secretion system protein ImpA